MSQRPSLRAFCTATLLWLTLLSFGCGFSETKSVRTARPNIVIIMADDMGYSDIGCYGSEIATPHLDSLAAGGVRFTQFYNTARCCPTRASLLTGLYPHQAGIGHMMDDRGVDGYRGNLNRRSVTVAEALRPAGYSTYMSGKWHVTRHTAPEGPKFNWPLQRGFDRFYGTITGAGSFWDPSTLVRDNRMLTHLSDPEYQPDEPYYYTDAISDHACRYVEEHDATRPFFLYVSYTAAHWPMHARPRDIAKYAGKYDAGYETIREARFARMKELGLIRPDAELSSAPGRWEDIDDKTWEAACMEVYAAMIDSMDQGIGRLVKKLKEKEIYDNTLIFYLQDNGGCAENGGRGQKLNPRAERPTLPIVAPDAFHYKGAWPRQTRDGYPVRGGRVMPGPEDTFIGYGKNWANVSNTPFREYKHWVHEGGISTPLIAHWPAGIRARNELRHQAGHLVDLMATCVDLAGATYPQSVGEQAIQPREGRSLVPAFKNEELTREAIFWEHEGNRAVRVGRWKLVAKGKHGQDDVAWELYNVEADRSELHNLANAQPERVRDMAARWLAYAERAHVLPWPQKRR
jgi:arylsulfatase A-like enzyme